MKRCNNFEAEYLFLTLTMGLGLLDPDLPFYEQKLEIILATVHQWLWIPLPNENSQKHDNDEGKYLEIYWKKKFCLIILQIWKKAGRSTQKMKIHMFKTLPSFLYQVFINSSANVVVYEKWTGIRYVGQFGFIRFTHSKEVGPQSVTFSSQQ